MTSEESNDRDDVIQASLDAGEPLPADADVVSYQQLYGALSQSTARLSPEFASRVLATLTASRAARTGTVSSMVSFLVTGVALGLGVGAAYLMSLLGYGDVSRWPGTWRLADLPVLPAFTVASLLALALLDKVFHSARVREV